MTNNEIVINIEQILSKHRVRNNTVDEVFAPEALRDVFCFLDEYNIPYEHETIEHYDYYHWDEIIAYKDKHDCVRLIHWEVESKNVV